MHLSSAVVADEQTPELMQPGEGTFDYPAVYAQSGTMGRLTAGNHGFDTALSDFASVAVMIIATVGKQTIRPASRPSHLAPHRRYAIEKRDKLGDVVAVATRQRESERESACVDEEVVFRAPVPAVDRARARLGAPFLACTWLPSMTARDQSISPEPRSLARMVSWRRSHTPACCHSSRRRQQVIPDPNPNSCGRWRQAMPV